MTSQGRQIARSVTPPSEVPAAEKVGRKRAAPTAMAKANSTNTNINTVVAAVGERASKRRSIANATSSKNTSKQILSTFFNDPQHHQHQHHPHPHLATNQQSDNLVGLGLMAPIARSHSFSAPSSTHPNNLPHGSGGNTSSLAMGRHMSFAAPSSSSSLSNENSPYPIPPPLPPSSILLASPNSRFSHSLDGIQYCDRPLVPSTLLWPLLPARSLRVSSSYSSAAWTRT